MSNIRNEQRHHVIIMHDCSGGANFKEEVNIPFVPDEVILRNVNFRYIDGGNDYVGLFQVRCNMLLNPLCSLYNNCNYSPQTVFPLGKSVNTTWKFEITTMFGGEAFFLDASNNRFFDGLLSLTLEFVKY